MKNDDFSRKAKELLCNKCKKKNLLIINKQINVFEIKIKQKCLNMRNAYYIKFW